MKRTRNLTLIAVVLMAAIGCTKDEAADAETVVTPDINVAPYYFSFAGGNAVDNVPDITFKAIGQSYAVVANGAAGVSAVSDTGDFASGVLAVSTVMGFDDEDNSMLVIGDNWMDVSTYNMADNHSIMSDGSFYYLRLASYNVVKFQVTKGSQVAFDIQYAIQSNDSTAGSTVTKSVAYSSDAPAEFDFTTGNAFASSSWNVGLIMDPVLDEESGTIRPAPAVIVNFANGSRVAVLTNQNFEELDAVPASGVSWQTETATTRPFGYGGGNLEVLVYQGPPTHKVLVQNPDYVYIVDDGDGNYYKLRFNDYEAGIIGFEYLAL